MSSLLKKFSITLKPCRFRDYQLLAQFHYRSGSPGPSKTCFGLYCPSLSRITNNPQLIGIIVYSMPPLNSRARTLAAGTLFSVQPTRRDRIAFLNQHFRTISRVIIHPQFRSIGLAAELVRQTLPLVGTPYIEASAVMGAFHPFFENAGMTRYSPPPSKSQTALLSAFHHIGIESELLLSPSKTLERINSLSADKKKFILTQIQKHYITPRQAAFSSKIHPDLSWLLPRISSFLLTNPTYFFWKK